LACLNKSGSGGEPLMIFKILKTSSDFILIFNILTRLMPKALQYNLHSDQYYTALNKQDTSGTPKGFYYCTNKSQVVLD
jgi:hypothetical protein